MIGSVRSAESTNRYDTDLQETECQNEKASTSGTGLFMVRLAGFEPTTPWFVAKYSIQLSYSR